MADHNPTIRDIGEAGEDNAFQFLQNQGLKLIARNWRNRCGEIDLIMQDNNTVVFIEVRCRNHNGFTSPLESIHFKKMMRIRKASEHWLHCENGKHGAEYKNIRYDVVGISRGKLEWIKNAFDADGL